MVTLILYRNTYSPMKWIISVGQLSKQFVWPAHKCEKWDILLKNAKKWDILPFSVFVFVAMVTKIAIRFFFSQMVQHYILCIPCYCFLHLWYVALSAMKCWWILTLFPALDNFKFLSISVKCYCSTQFKLHSASDIIWINGLFPSLTKFSTMHVVENLKENEKYDFFAIFSSFGCHGNQGSYSKIKKICNWFELFVWHSLLHFKKFISHDSCFIHLANVALSAIKCWWILTLFPVLDNFKCLSISLKCYCSTQFKFHSATDIIWMHGLFPSLIQFSMMNEVYILTEYKKIRFFCHFFNFLLPW